jgi:hypothetical protein
MTTYQKSFLIEVLDDKKPIPEDKLAYFRERQRSRLFDAIVSKFLEKEKAGKLTKAGLARRINKKPEQITRWLSTPNNWTLDTVSDLTLGICNGEHPFPPVTPFVVINRNDMQTDYLYSRNNDYTLRPRTFISSGTSSAVNGIKFEGARV